MTVGDPGAGAVICRCPESILKVDRRGVIAGLQTGMLAALRIRGLDLAQETQEDVERQALLFDGVERIREALPKATVAENAGKAAAVIIKTCKPPSRTWMVKENPRPPPPLGNVFQHPVTAGPVAQRRWARSRSVDRIRACSKVAPRSNVAGESRSPCRPGPSPGNPRRRERIPCWLRTSTRQSPSRKTSRRRAAHPHQGDRRGRRHGRVEVRRSPANGLGKRHVRAASTHLERLQGFGVDRNSFSLGVEMLDEKGIVAAAFGKQPLRTQGDRPIDDPACQGSRRGRGLR